jgi:ankyrin repeat protein
MHNEKDWQGYGGSPYLLPEETRQIEKCNAFNTCRDLGYWYQDSDITAIASLLIKDFENISFVGAIGRSQYQSVDAKKILESKKVELTADKRLVGIYNTGGNHWIAFIIFKDLVGRTTCCYKDSLGEERIDFEQDVGAVFTEVKINCLQKGQAEQTEELDNAIADNNGLVSCGVFALKNLGTLTSCANFGEAEFYNPGKNLEEYEYNVRAARREYGLLYAKSIYDGLPDNDNRLKELFIELKITSEQKKDIELLKDLSEALCIDLEEIRQALGIVDVSSIKNTRKSDVTLEDAVEAIDCPQIEATGSTVKQEPSDAEPIKIAKKDLPLPDKGGKIKKAIMVWLDAAQSVHPDLIIPMLKSIHNLQLHWMVPELTAVINELFVKCAPHINREYTQSHSEYRDLGLGLVYCRLDFIIEQSEIDKIRKALRTTATREMHLENFPALVNNIILEGGVEARKQNAVVDIGYSEIGSQDYNEALEEYGDIAAYQEQYESAAMCYSLLSPGRLEKRLMELEAKIVLSIPAHPVNLVLNNINKYQVNGYTSAKPILEELEQAGNLFLQAGKYEAAIKIYQKLLSLTQNLQDSGISLVPSKLFELEKSVFIKLSHACKGEKVSLDKANQHKNKLTKIREEQNINNELTQQKWNKDFEHLLKDIVREAEAQLGCIYKCAIMSIGSLARREASIYSDVDLMIITKDEIHNNADCKKYYKALIELIKVKIISLGEMPGLPAGLTERVKSTIKLHYDVAGFFPNIERAICIGTAKELIEDVAIEYQHYQYQAAIQDSLLLNSGKEAEEIYQEYQEALTRRNELAQASITNQLELAEFKLKLGEGFNEIDIKNNILRYPMLLINRMFAYYGLKLEKTDIQQTVTEQKIDALVEKSKEINLENVEGWQDFLLYCFSEARAEGLKEWLKLGHELRIKAHYLYGSSQDSSEKVFVDKEAGKIYLTNENGRHGLCDLEKLQSLYEKQMQPLYRLVELWIKAIKCKSEERLSTILREESVELLQEYERTGNIEYANQANWYYEKSVAFDLEGTEKAWIESIKDLGDTGRLSGYKLKFVGNNDSIIRLPLKEEIEKQYRDKGNQEIEGRRNVIKVKINGHYFHIKECPEAPGMEYAVSSLSHLLFGYTTTPFSTLAKLTKSNGDVIPVLISRTVLGESLKNILEKDPKFLDEHVDAESYGLSFMRTLLTDPDDDQVGNYVVQCRTNPAGENKKRLICIDSDHGFLEKETVKSILYFADRMATESINQVVKNTILEFNPERLETWLKNLAKRDTCNRRLFEDDSLKKSYPITKHGKPEKVITEIAIFLSFNVCRELYNKIIHLQDILSEDGEKEYKEIFLKVTPLQGEKYLKFLERSKDKSPHERFDEKFDKYYQKKVFSPAPEEGTKVIKCSTAIANRTYLESQLIQVLPILQTRHNISKVLEDFREFLDQYKNFLEIRKRLIKGEEPDTKLPLELRQMIINGKDAIGKSPSIDNIFKAIAKHHNDNMRSLRQEQRNVLEVIKAHFSVITYYEFIHQFKRLNLSGCIEIRDDDLKALLHEQMECLNITGCNGISAAGLEVIATKCRKLESLHVSYNIIQRGFKPEGLKFNSLKRLNIPDCEKIDHKIKKVIEACPKLEKLFLPDKGWLEVVKNLSINIIKITACSNINIKDSNGQTTLMWAVQNGKEEVVEFLLERGVDIEAKDQFNRTALMHAVENGFKAAVKLLLEKGAQVDHYDTKNENLLDYAFRLDFRRGPKNEIIELISMCPEAINLKSKDGTTLLMFSVLHGLTKILEQLLAKGSDIEAKDNQGNTALIYALENVRKEITEILLKNEADIESKDKDSNTALIWAAKNNKKAAAELMLEKGADIEAKDKDGNTALIWAAYNGKKEIVELLLKNKAYVEARNNDSNTALICAVQSGNEELVELLLKNKAYVEAKNKDGNTALMFAVKDGKIKVVEQLIAMKADLYAKNNDDKTVLDFALTDYKSDKKDVIMLCLEANDLLCKNSMTALMRAAYDGNKELVELLVNSGFQDTEEDHALIALTLAAFRHHKDVMMVILKKLEEKSFIQTMWLLPEDRPEIIGTKPDGIMNFVSSIVDKRAGVAESLLIEGIIWSMRCGLKDNEKITEFFVNKGIQFLESIEALGNEEEKLLEFLMVCTAMLGCTEQMKWLLKKGANINGGNESGGTALMGIAFREHKEAEEYFSENKMRMTVLTIAASCGHRDLMKLLIEEGADVNVRMGGDKKLLIDGLNGNRGAAELWGVTVKHLFGGVLGQSVAGALKQNDGVMKFLLKNLDIKVEKESGNTALMMAALSGFEEVAELLIERGANIEARDELGRTALTFAILGRNKKAVELLIKKGADTQIQIASGITALMQAATMGNAEITAILLNENNANINAKDNNGVTALLYAAEMGHEEIVELLIERGADIEARDRLGKTALMYAASGGHEKIAKLLIKKGKNIQAQNNNGFTALMQAVEKGHKKIVELLLKNGANIEAISASGSTALSIASVKGHKDIVELLLNSKANTEVKDIVGTTVLMCAALGGHNEVVEVLLEGGANIQAKNNNYETALTKAASNGHADVINLLLPKLLLINKDQGIEAKNVNGATALMLAAENGHADIIKILLNAEADIEAKDKLGRTALIIAAMKGHKDIVELLLKNKGNIKCKDINGLTVLMSAALMGYNEIVDILLENGEDVNAKDINGATALMLAALGGHEKVVEVLLSKGANIEARNMQGITALLFAVSKGHTEIVKLLLENKADVNVNISGKTFLMVALENSHEKIIELLIKHGANIEAIDSSGKTALMLAVEKGRINIVKLLLERGANIKIVDSFGSTMMMIASAKGYEKIVELLIKHGANIEAIDLNGNTALMCAARAGYQDIVELLLERKANIDAINLDGVTALMWTALEGHEKIAELLLERGADKKAANIYDSTTIMYAAVGGNKEIVELLIKNTDIEIKNNKGCTAFIAAVLGGHKDVIELLIENGANIDAKGDDNFTALMLMAYHGNHEVAELLLNHNADFEAEDGHGNTALLLAARNGNDKVVKLLLNGSANIEAKGGIRKQTPLIAAAEEGHKDVVESLFQYGADIEAKDINNKTALIWVVYNGYKQIVEFLLAKGVEVGAIDDTGKTALDYALEKEYGDIYAMIQTNQNQDKNLRRCEQETLELILGKKVKLKEVVLYDNKLVTTIEEIQPLGIPNKSSIILIPENNHIKQHASNIHNIMKLIDSKQLSQNTIIALERKQQGNSFGMPDVISLASNMEVPEFIKDLPIYQDAKLYNLARLKGIVVIGVEGKGLPVAKESPLYNQVREDYMASKLMEYASLVYNVIFPVGSAHVEGLKSRLEGKGINASVWNSVTESENFAVGI